MATTAVEICNSALTKIGAERITSLEDDSPRAVLCNERYALLRDQVLRAHPWNFAIKRAALPQLATTPVFEWAYEYQLPTDCLKVLNTEEHSRFKVEGRKILSNEGAPLNIRYIYKNENVGDYDPVFVEALSCRIAVDLCYSITNSTTMAESMLAAYRAQLSEARSMDAQEGSPEDWIVDEWLNAHR